MKSVGPVLYTIRLGSYKKNCHGVAKLLVWKVQTFHIFAEFKERIGDGRVRLAGEDNFGQQKINTQRQRAFMRVELIRLFATPFRQVDHTHVTFNSLIPLY